MMRSYTLLSLVTLSLQLQSSWSFSSSAPITTMGMRPFASSLVSKPKLGGISGFFSASSSNNADAVLREIEKKEAAILKRKHDAMEKINQYEASLGALQAKKEEYTYAAAAQVSEPPVGGTFSETTMRSLVKSLCWRLVAGSVTFVTTLKFSGSMSMALQVVGADFFSKAFTMFIGERLMNKSQAGRKNGGDDAGRSLVKALIWRLFAIANTLTMAIFVSKDLSVASKIASTDAVFKTGLMFVYERIWARIQWGKEYLIEFSI